MTRIYGDGCVPVETPVRVLPEIQVLNRDRDRSGKVDEEVEVDLGPVQ